MNGPEDEWLHYLFFGQNKYRELADLDRACSLILAGVSQNCEGARSVRSE